MPTLRIVIGAVMLLFLSGCATPTVVADHPPVVKAQFRPQFPFELFQAGTSGFAKVRFTVTTDGNVMDPVVIEASHEDFGRSAVACISKWKFEPGVRDGRPVAVHMEMPFTFDNAAARKEQSR